MKFTILLAFLLLPAFAQQPVANAISSGNGPPDPGVCSGVTVGAVYVRSGNPSIAPIGVYRCTQSGGAAIYSWQPIGHLVVATLPTKCNVGDIGYQTGGTTGVYACTATDTWTLNAGAGTVTSVGSGTGLTGGPITTTGTMSVVTTLIAQKFFGTAAPGSVATNLPGDLYTDTTNHNEYVCNAPSGTAAPACTSVATAGWLLLNNGSGSGTVTVVGAGSLTSTALVTGGGTTTIQTPNTTATLDSSGNIATPGALTAGVGSGFNGALDLVNGTGAPTIAANSWRLTSPASISTAFSWTGPSAIGSSGLVRLAVSGQNGTISQSELSGAVVTSGSNATVMATIYRYRTCDIPVGDTSGSAITNSQLGPQSRVCFIPAAATIVEMDVNADNGTPNVIIGKNHAGSISNIVSSALATAASGGIACSNTGGTTGLNGATTCSSTLQNTSLSAGDYLELVSGTAGGTAKFFAVHITYTVN